MQNHLFSIKTLRSYLELAAGETGNKAFVIRCHLFGNIYITTARTIETFNDLNRLAIA